MSVAKKPGYNWKARQQKCVANKRIRGHTGKEDCEGHVELDQSCFSGYFEASPQDTNAQVLPPKKPKFSDKDDLGTVKRKKLSAKQKKRLLKVIEVKEKKAKHAAILDSLASVSLPESHTALLQSSAQLGRAKKTRKQVLNHIQLQSRVQNLAKPSRNNGRRLSGDDAVSFGDAAHLVGTTWRKKKKRFKPLKVEKVLYDPKPPQSPTPDDDKSGNGSNFEEDYGNNSQSNIVEEDQQGQQSEGEVCSGGGDQNTDDVGGVGTEEEVMNRKGPGKWERKESGGAHSAGRTREGEAREKEKGRCPAKYVQLVRDPDIQCARLSLPILSEEQVVMEAIHDHPVVVLCGETGSGKTTQVPQFLYEAGYTIRGRGDLEEGSRRSLIGVTEPRRVAAVSMARRVGEEMGFKGQQVAYQIRYEGNTSDDTEIKFMTDGVLLKEVEKDFLLSRYSVIIIDEAHERSVFTDVLIGLLSRIVPLREKTGNPLKLVIMSATLRIGDFTENTLLFPSPPPVIRVESRQYSVTVHFNRVTPDDYINEAFRKTCKIHRGLQPGNILIFVTGQREVHTLCRKLSRRFPRQCTTQSVNANASKAGGEELEEQRRTKEEGNDSPLHTLSDSICGDEEGMEGELESGVESEQEEELGIFEQEERLSFDSQLPMKVLPLYSLLSPSQQAKVFQPPPEGVRLCVVATNVAETSLTIPNIKYVVDSGKVKRKYHDKVTGISTFRICWISKASANQRAGRAGRTEPGHCYRLYSSAIFSNEFEEFSPPEITRRPVEDLVLQMKAMNIDRVINFPFPTPPSAVALSAAEKLLVRLGALKPSDNHERLTSQNPCNPCVVTPLGKTMARFPVAPRYAKMLALGKQHGCLPYIIALVSALSVKELFVEEGVGEEEEGREDRRRRDQCVKLRRSWVGKGESLLLGDLMVLLRVVGASEYAGCSEEFCSKYGVRQKAMIEVRKLRQQLTNTVNVLCPEESVVLDPRMPPLSQEQARYIRQLMLSGLGDHVARKISTQGMNAEDKKKFRYAYQSVLCEDPVYIHSSSVLLYENPEFLVFQEITETTKLYMRCVCAVEASWLPHIQREYCTFSPPLENPPPFFEDGTGTIKCHMTATYGECNWPIGSHELVYPDSLMKYKLFAMFLLQGKVVSSFGRFSPYLLVAPISLIKKWSKLHSQCEVLVAALANKEVCSRTKLLDTWKEDPKYLLKACSLWLPESRHKALSLLWPPTE